MTRWERFYYGALAVVFIAALGGCAAVIDAAHIAKTAAKACIDRHC
jgi:hypothetical protein